MRCNICGYEDNKTFSVCPYCGEKVNVSANNFFGNNGGYNGIGQNNQNSQNIQININNGQPTYTSQPTYTPQRDNSSKYGYNITKYFKGLGCSFEQTGDELIMSRSLNGGDFAIWAIVAFISVVLLGALSVSFTSEFAFIFIMLFAFFGSFIFTRATIRVNPRGIFVKTIFKEYVIPREKIDKCFHKVVRRRRGRYGHEDLDDVFIRLNDYDLFKKMEIDMGLCYRDIQPALYLVDEFNRILGI